MIDPSSTDRPCAICGGGPTHYCGLCDSHLCKRCAARWDWRAVAAAKKAIDALRGAK